MPRIRAGDASPETQPHTWQETFVERIRAGKVTPVISNAFGENIVLGGHDKLVQDYARYSHYPLEQAALPHMAQFKSITDESVADALAIKDDYVNFVKNQLFDIAVAEGASEEALAGVEAQFDDLKLLDFCKQLSYPNFADGDKNPLLILADLPLPIYITTGYHAFIEAALCQVGKVPRTEICRWHKDLERIDLVFATEHSYQPSPKQPLVYHLYGFDAYPDSLVLTEDDYLRFLVNTAQDVGRETDCVHKVVRQAISDSSLLLLGYNLGDWDFRALFWGLIDKRTRKLAGAVTIQALPNWMNEFYANRYLGKFEFKVVWKAVPEFLKELQGSFTDKPEGTEDVEASN